MPAMPDSSATLPPPITFRVELATSGWSYSAIEDYYMDDATYYCYQAFVVLY